jgi:hypothetical protein
LIAAATVWPFWSAAGLSPHDRPRRRLFLERSMEALELDLILSSACLAAGLIISGYAIARFRS